jgi:hypothetical protein
LLQSHFSKRPILFLFFSTRAVNLEFKLFKKLERFVTEGFRLLLMERPILFLVFSTHLRTDPRKHLLGEIRERSEEEQ